MTVCVIVLQERSYLTQSAHVPHLVGRLESC